VVFGMPNMCLLDACMDMPLASVWTVGRILFVFNV
jgi:hypothetical protein